MSESGSRRFGRASGGFLLAATSLVVTLVLLALLELLAGKLLPAPPAAAPDGEIEGDTVSRTLAWLDINPVPLVRDDDLLWRNEPGARKTQPVNPRPFGRPQSWTLENNSEGFRGAERAKEADARPYRILCIGDSITFGFNVDQPDTFPEQLSRLLHDRYRGRSFEVINAGVPGWTWLQGLKFLETRAPGLRPDLVVIGHGTNDQYFHAKITDEERFHLVESSFDRTRRGVEEWLQHFNLYRLALSLRYAPGDRLSRECRKQIGATGFCRRVPLEHIGSAVEKVADLARGGGRDLLVLNTDFLETGAVSASREVAARRQLAFLDTVAELDARRRADAEAASRRLGLASPLPAPSQDGEPSPQAEKRDKRIVLRVLVPDRAGVYRIDAMPAVESAAELQVTAHDDGLDGDEKAADGVFSAAVSIPAACQSLEYRFSKDGASELEPLPPRPSTFGRRLLKTPASGYGPVDRFGVLPFMAEQTHPDREGHALIAELVAGKLPSFASFARFTAAEAAKPPR